MRKKVLIQGMSCQHCVQHITEILKKLEGIISVDVRLEGRYALVEGNITDEKIKEEIEAQGFDVIEIQ